MKNFVLVLAALLVFTSWTFAAAASLIVTVTNPGAFARVGETVEVPWTEVRNVLPTAMPEALVVRDPAGREVAAQICGNVFVFQTDLAAKQTKHFRIEPGKPAAATVKTYAGFMQPRKDIAWESDRIAYRLYGPGMLGVDNGFDVWVKRVRTPIVEKWYAGDEKQGGARVSYHEDHGEGADFFNVGTSLGAGSCAPYVDAHLWQPGVFKRYRIISQGPIRTQFEVEYESIVAGVETKETKQITLDAGQNLSRVRVTYTGLSGIPLAMGLVKRPRVAPIMGKDNTWIALWGPTDSVAANGSLGTAVVVARGVGDVVVDDSLHLLLLGTARSGVPFTYLAGAGWTRSQDFPTDRSWAAYLDEWSRRLSQPVTVSFSAGR